MSTAVFHTAAGPPSSAIDDHATFPGGSDGAGLDGLKSYLRQRRQDDFVDHLCRTILGRRSTAAILEACVVVTGVSPSTLITNTHMVATWRFVCVAATLLDSSQHMSR